MMEPKDAKALMDDIDQGLHLTEEEFIAKITKDMMGGWVPLQVYLQAYPMETANAVHNRVRRGHWQHRVHYSAPKGGGAWVNVPAIRLWLEGQAVTRSGESTP